MAPRNDALKQAQADVPADSSLAPADTSDVVDTAPEAVESSGDSDHKESGQTLKQMRAEILRKVDDRFARLESKLDSVVVQPQQGTPASPTSLDDMSTADLEALRPHITQDKLAAFEELVKTRREEERVDARLDKRLSQREVIATRKRANSDAYTRYPELHNERGALYTEVNKILDERGDDIVRRDPYSVLNAANEAAHRLGIKPTARSERNPSSHIGSRTAPSADADDGVEQLSMGEAKDIADRLSAALPAGKKFTPETLKRLQANTAEYRKHQDLFIK
jgi:hypothetical protein